MTTSLQLTTIKAIVSKKSTLAGYVEITSIDMVEPAKVIDWSELVHHLLCVWWNLDPETVEDHEYMMRLERHGLTIASARGKFRAVDGYVEAAWF